MKERKGHLTPGWLNTRKSLRIRLLWHNHIPRAFYKVTLCFQINYGAKKTYAGRFILRTARNTYIMPALLLSKHKLSGSRERMDKGEILNVRWLNHCTGNILKSLLYHDRIKVYSLRISILHDLCPVSANPLSQPYQITAALGTVSH